MGSSIRTVLVIEKFKDLTEKIRLLFTEEMIEENLIYFMFEHSDSIISKAKKNALKSFSYQHH